MAEGPRGPAARAPNVMEEVWWCCARGLPSVLRRRVACRVTRSELSWRENLTRSGESVRAVSRARRSCALRVPCVPSKGLKDLGECSQSPVVRRDDRARRACRVTRAVSGRR